MITQGWLDAISGPQAAELANITYRQLDYWARQGWVTPSVERGVGRPGRRIYGPQDVVKLAALGHFGRSGVDVGQLGPAIAGLDLPEVPDDYLLVTTGGQDIELIAGSELRATVSSPGARSVFDPSKVLRAMSVDRTGASSSRRTA